MVSLEGWEGRAATAVQPATALLTARRLDRYRVGARGTNVAGAFFCAGDRRCADGRLESVIDQLRVALPDSASFLDVRASYSSWDTVVDRTGSGELADDPDFARLATCGMTELFDAIPFVVAPKDAVVVVFGPRLLRSVGSCSEEIIGELPEMFFQVRRFGAGRA